MRDRPYGLFDTSDIPPSAAGSPMKTEYAAEVGLDGNIVLHEIGETDFQAYIQSHEESCNINTIMQRYAAGDESVLQRRQMLFFDATDFPTTYPEMFERMQQANRFFAAQSAEFKERYNNNPQTFLASLEDPKNVAALAKELYDEEMRRANPAGDSLDRTPNVAHFEAVGKSAERMAVTMEMAKPSVMEKDGEINA